MAKILVLYYSMYGHIETMAHAVAEGAKKVDGAEVIIKRVPETMPPEIFAKLAVKHKTHRLPPHRSWRITMPLFLVRQPGLAICQARCVPSWTKPADCGHPARYTASSAACSVLPERAAARSRPSPRPGLLLPIMGW